MFFTQLFESNLIKFNPKVVYYTSTNSTNKDVWELFSEYEKNLKNDPRWNQLRAVREKKVFAVDANSFFSKPSIRVVTGIEILAKILHPDTFTKLEVPNNSFLKI